MIEAVPNSITLAKMIAEHARGSKFKAARTVFGDKAIMLRWLCEAHNIDYIKFEQNLHLRSPHHHHPSNKKITTTATTPMSREIHDAIYNFAASCAGSVVFTYVLGIGDRHNDNIMLQKSGKLFHIDFGHFLGNFKSKFGVKRETAPFIFTPAMAHVLHALPNGYQRFEELACRAFNVLRQHSTLLVSLFSLMLSCGIPELKTMDDITFLEKKLMLDATNLEASNHLKNQIALSLKTKMTQLNDAIHVLKHH
jgi:phosphatidylinositol kinase/protein kinase (PI-3  family)